eukprot:scaffold27434_cov50-Phaeocystis_antarctica.AAC.4
MRRLAEVAPGSDTASVLITGITVLQEMVAWLAGVRTSAVTVETAGTRRLTEVAPGSDTASVLITVIITVPASTTAAAVQNSLSSTLNSAAAATEALGINVVAVPTVSIPSSPSPPPPSQQPLLALD